MVGSHPPRSLPSAIACQSKSKLVAAVGETQKKGVGTELESRRCLRFLVTAGATNRGKTIDQCAGLNRVIALGKELTRIFYSATISIRSAYAVISTLILSHLIPPHSASWHAPGHHERVQDIAGTDEDGVPAQLTDRETFVAAMEERGLGGGQRVVVYDNGDMLFATRFWWAMR